MSRMKDSTEEDDRRLVEMRRLVDDPTKWRWCYGRQVLDRNAVLAILDGKSPTSPLVPVLGGDA